MSYILEALASSEQARQQIVAAPKYSLLPVMGEEAPQPRRWPYALAGALLLNAVVLQLWLRPAPAGGVASTNPPSMPLLAQTPAASAAAIAPLVRSATPAADVAAVTPQPQVQEIGESRGVRVAAPADASARTASAYRANDSAARIQHMPRSTPKATAKRDAEAVVATRPNPSASQSPASVANASAKRSVEAGSATHANATAALASKASAKRGTETSIATAAAPTSPPSMISSSSAPVAGTAELPPFLHQELPVLSVAGFIRDEGASSMVIVNDRLLREGDEAAPGVKLEKILNDGLVFNYKGYRFKR